jgi:UDP-N-acetylglucosamine/UDP-N-acetylgalactosamine 4-epimerase
VFIDKREALNQVYNVACGEPCSILDLYNLISGLLKIKLKPQFDQMRKGDILHSSADISKAELFLRYRPQVSLLQGLTLLVN